MTDAVEEGIEALSFRDPDRAGALRERLADLVETVDTPVRVVHVCGSHEEAIAEYGLRAVLPDGLTVAMGPGCPVCVTDSAEVDEAVALARSGAVVATYGDMLRVPGSDGSLADARDEGADVRVVYSAAEAADIARETDDEVVFFGVGFETTAAPTASVLREGVPSNFSVLSAHKYVPPAMELVADHPDTRVDGFLAAGHAATITGTEVYERVAADYDLPVVVGGFEPVDVLYGLVELLEQLADGTATVENAYPRCVSRAGNEAAQEALWTVFERVPGQWRGIAEVPDATLQLRAEYAAHDARERFDIDAGDGDDRATDCICGEIMAGRAEPADCPLLGEACTLADPVGACMVSDEGPCRIDQEYGEVRGR
ncbi:hydrogenase formation protein HypD [Haloarcula halophila]|uniref:hydrogenase formation protein HypD n=1 Tax=Haloarcula TaxID=2237 RepID=UPI0023E3FC4C|nr:hydrogenase formation protein HypD [Halomicroarcula sp. DFY41]